MLMCKYGTKYCCLIRDEENKDTPSGQEVTTSVETQETMDKNKVMYSTNDADTVKNGNIQI